MRQLPLICHDDEQLELHAKRELLLTTCAAAKAARSQASQSHTAGTAPPNAPPHCCGILAVESVARARAQSADFLPLKGTDHLAPKSVKKSVKTHSRFKKSPAAPKWACGAPAILRPHLSPSPPSAVTPRRYPAHYSHAKSPEYLVQRGS